MVRRFYDEMVESVIKERGKCTRWKDKIIGYISLGHDCISGKCHLRESYVYQMEGQNYWLYFFRE